MTEFALVQSGAVVRYSAFTGPAPVLAPNKGAWLPVVDSPDPAYDPLIEELSEPQETVQGGQLVRARSVVAKSLSAVKAERRDAVEAHMGDVFVAGFTVPATFNGVSLAPLAGHVLDVVTAQNKLDWLTSQAAYSAAVAGGAGALSEALFRTKANANVTVTYNQGLHTLLAMADWGKGIYRQRWILKDAINAAQTVAEVAAIDVTAGW